MAPIRTDESDACMRARQVESLSQFFPGSALSLALLSSMEPEMAQEAVIKDEPCEEVEVKADDKDDDKDDAKDEDLTSLEWLQKTDLLKGIGEDVCPEVAHVSYNPQKHVSSKPPFSFSGLIFMAIEDSPLKRLPVKDIYGWILSHFPYYANAPTGWKNSVRHNLSLNKCFKKVDKDRGMCVGKGSLWSVDPVYRPNLLQSLMKTPCHPFQQLNLLSESDIPQPQFPMFPGSNQEIAQRFSQDLFPFLNRQFSQSGMFDETASIIDVANTLMALKTYSSTRSYHGSETSSRSPSPPEFGSKEEKEFLRRRRLLKRRRRDTVFTVSPSDDHNYSVAATAETSSEDDDDLSSDDDDRLSIDTSDRKLRVVLPTRKRPRHDSQEEKLKIAEGADALLNLAGIRTDLLNNNSLKDTLNS